MAGIVHFSRFFVFMETAEHEFLNAAGTSVHTEIDSQNISWPRLSAHCDFVRPVRFEDWLDILVRVARKGTKSMTYQVDFEHEGHRIARGRITSVCCVLKPGRRPRSIEIPPTISDLISQCPDADLSVD